MNVAAPAKKPSLSPVEDVQGHADTRQIPINKVGIKDIYHPVNVKDRANGEQHTVANFNMYVNLPHNFKGTHMSRFVEILHRHEREISVDSFGKMLEEMTEHLHADRRTHRDDFSVLRHEKGAGLRRREPDELPGHHFRRIPQTARPTYGSRWWCRPRACARARRRSPTTARTTSARTSR